MSNMHDLLNEQEQLRAQVKTLGEQVNESLRFEAKNLRNW